MKQTLREINTGICDDYSKPHKALTLKIILNK